MGDLTNKQISATYDGLIKTSDEQPIDGNLKTLQDGVGNNLPIEVSTTGVNFTGTVTGIPAGTDTTYDFGAAGAAGNINFALTGSDATNDIVTMQAGTNITLTDNGSNNFTIDAAGGGGGGSSAAYYKSGLSPAMSNFSWNVTGVYNSPWITTGYSRTNFAVPADKSIYIPVIMKPGVNIGDFQFDVSVAGGTTDIGFYKSYQYTHTDNSKWLMPEYVATIASSVDVSTTGVKTITGVNIPIPTDSVDGVYWIAFSSNDTAYSLRRWSQIVWPWNFSQDIYRTLGMFDNNPSLFTGGQMTSFTGSGTTDSSVKMGWKYI